MSIKCVLGLDFETTGTDPKLDGILEIGAKVITPDFKVHGLYQTFVLQPQEVMDRMSPEVRAQHERSGLLDRIAESGIHFADAYQEVTNFIKLYFPKGGAILMGFSIQFDRGFIKEQMPEVEKQLHYRMLDARSLTLAEEIFGSPHRALEDIDAALDTVKTYVGRLK